MNSNATRTVELIDAEIATLQAERVQLVRAGKNRLQIGQHDKVAVGTPGRLVTLDGRPIAGSYEVMYGKSGITGATRNPDGSLSFVYDGAGTEVYWNGQKTVRSSQGEIVFLDEDGEPVHESQVKLVSVAGDDADEEARE